jgi:hypothetical protein
LMIQNPTVTAGTFDMWTGSLKSRPSVPML